MAYSPFRKSETAENISEASRPPQDAVLIRDTVDAATFEDCSLDRSEPTQEAAIPSVTAQLFEDCALEKSPVSERPEKTAMETTDLTSAEMPLWGETVEENQVAEISPLGETFERKELEETTERLYPTYENGRDVADNLGVFQSYKEHHRLEGGHIEKVHNKSLEAASAANKHFSRNDYGGLYSGEVDLKSLEMMALYHDSGMDRNLTLDDLESYKREILGRMERGELKQDLQKSMEADLRERHSVESAIHVLRDRGYTQSKGVDADQVALGCLLHSKSASGVYNLADNTQWETAIDRLEAAAGDYNRTHPEDPVSFSADFLREADGSLSQEKMAQMRTQGLCLRVGDANGHNYESLTTQDGKELSFDLEDWTARGAEMSDDFRRHIRAADPAFLSEEVRTAQVTVDGVPLGESDVISKAYALGEGNFKSLDFTAADDGTLEEAVTLVKGDAYPLSTQFCIEERVKEMCSAATDSSPAIPTRHEGMSEEDYKKGMKRVMEEFYRQDKVDMKLSIDLGDVSPLTLESYSAFAAKIEANYRIPVEVRHAKS